LGDIFKVKLTILYIQFLENIAGETIFKKLSVPVSIKNLAVDPLGVEFIALFY